MNYYIKANKEPKERASFYIIQNVGALLEDDHQDGLAHFLEHMALNGTKHFPEKGIINFLERHGVALGENINASTSQNETVYNLSDVPVNKPGIMDTCLLILHDWSHFLLLTDEEIDAERGVIKEEWRTSWDAQRRMFTASLPYLYPNSKFAERDVIGEMEVIENFKYDVLRDFYHTWYRTDLQAIAMVGDFDAKEMEQKVKQMFSQIPQVENPPERPFYEIPDHEEPIYGLVTDKEADQTIIRYLIRHRKEKTGPETLLDHREDYIRELFNSMMGQRINELLQQGDPPFVFGIVNYGDFERGYEALTVALLPKPNEEARGLAAILTELERAKRFGFNPGELERAKAEILTQWEKYYNERDKIHNEEYINDYVNHFLDGEAFLSADQGYMLVQAVLPTISTEDFNQRIPGWVTDRNRVLVIQGPEGEEFVHLTQAEAFSVFEMVSASVIEPYAEDQLAESLVSEEVPLNGVLSTKELEVFDAVEWTLENGARVIFRHADFEKDQVQIRGYSVGGGSRYENEDVPTINLLTALTSFYGVGDYDVTTLQKMLAGKNVSLNLQLGGLFEEVSGSATPRDIEIMMQLLYLSFNQPRFDNEAHNAIMARYRALVENMGNNPQKIMGDSLSLILTNYHPRTRILDLAFLDDIEFERIEQIYRDRFTDASDFIFIIVGNIEAAEVEMLARKYIGSIPDLERKESWIDRKVREPEGVVKKEIVLALEIPKANVNLVFHQPMEYSAYNSLVLRVIQGILDLRFTETIREEEGGTYGVQVGTDLQHWPVELASLQVTFDCDPGRAEDLKQKVYLELEKLASAGPTKEDLSKTVENLLKTREQSKEHNSYYLNALYNYYIHGINFDDPANYEGILKELSVKDVKKTMKALYKDPNIVDVVFLPLQKEGAIP
jgi:zinc protease